MTVCKSIAIIPEPPVETLKCDERFQPVFRKKQIAKMALFALGTAESGVAGTKTRKSVET